jgi:hypothetical protein
MFIGLGVVAVWAHLQFPRLRPDSLLRAILHVATRLPSERSRPCRPDWAFCCRSRPLPRRPDTSCWRSSSRPSHTCFSPGSGSSPAPARPLRRHTSRRPSCLERVMSRRVLRPSFQKELHGEIDEHGNPDHPFCSPLAGTSECTSRSAGPCTSVGEGVRIRVPTEQHSAYHSARVP